MPDCELYNHYQTIFVALDVEVAKLQNSFEFQKNTLKYFYFLEQKQQSVARSQHFFKKVLVMRNIFIIFAPTK